LELCPGDAEANYRYGIEQLIFRGWEIS
jgi:hypothetical protein